ncbi:NupC/NupG family nucleoside CNT transporter [Thermostilla marina]
MPRVAGALGLFVMLFVAWLMSERRRRMHWRLILSGLALQFLIAVVLLRTPVGEGAFIAAREAISKLQDFVDAGSSFVFGENFREHLVAFSVLPVIIFVSSVSAVLFHLGVLQFLVKLLARIMVWVMDVSGAESLAAAGNIYLGMTEAPLLIRPYLASMTRSELMAMMTSGMATIAGSVMAAYVAMGADAGHILAASLMSAPASLVIAKIMVPEIEESPTKGTVKIQVPRSDVNILDAACRGASDGLKLALNVAAMLIAFVAIVAMLNWGLSCFGDIGGSPLTLERILGWVFAPFAWLMGVPWQDAKTVGMLLGERTVLNEFIAYQHMTGVRELVSPRSYTIATYALCGFANFGSIAVMIGGVGSLEPKRRFDFATLGLRSMIGGTLACYMTATIAGILIP